MRQVRQHEVLLINIPKWILLSLSLVLTLLFTYTVSLLFNSKRGGALISAIFGFLHHGDPVSSATVKTLLTCVCKPMYNMILKWIFDGILEDPFTEFFIADNMKVQDESRLWHDKYSIRRSMIPKFMGLSLGKKILATGKGLNFLRSVCKEDSPIPGREVVMNKLNGLSAELLFR